MNSTEEYLDSLLRSVTEGTPPPVPPTRQPSINAAPKPVAPAAIIEEPAAASPVIENTLFEKQFNEEPVTAEPVMPEPVMAEPIAEEPAVEEITIEEPIAEEPAVEEITIEEPIVEEPAIEEITIEEPAIEESIIEDSMLDDGLNLSMEDGEDAFNTDEEHPDEDISNLLKSIEEMGSPLEDELSIDDLLNEAHEEELPEEEELSMEEELPQEEDISMEEEIPMEEASLDEVSVDDALINDIDLMDPFADIDESSEDISAEEVSDEAGLEDLLSGAGDDEELSAIGDLLSMDDQNEAVDEDAIGNEIDFSAEGDIDEPLDEFILDDDETAGKKKKKNKKVKKEKAPKDKEEKKAGFFSKIMDSLTKEVEEEEEAKNIFEESAVDIAVETAAENEKIMNESDDEDEEGEGEKGKKGKKSKKEKKPKEKKKKKPKDEFIDFDPGPYKKLPLKKVIVICILCFSLGVIITLVTYLYPYYRDTKTAQSAFDHGDYLATYTDLKGHNLNKKQQELYQKSVVILKVERKLQSYEKYMSLNMRSQALDALLQGLKNADDYSAQAEELGIIETFDSYRTQIENIIREKFALDISEAYEWAHMEDPEEYSRNIYRLIIGSPQTVGVVNGSPTNDVLSGSDSENAVIAGEESEFLNDSIN